MLGVCCWHFLRGHEVDLFRKAAKLALIVAVPVTLLQLVVGNRFGEAVTSAQSMKIAASEAQWNTCQPCGFSLFQIGGFTADDPTPKFSISIPRLLSYMATGSFDGQVQGLNQLQKQEQRKYGRGNYMPNVRVIYWSMRVMAFAGVLMFLVAALGAWLYWKRRLEQRTLVPVDRDRRDRPAVHRRDRGLDPHRDGAPALDRAGAAARPPTANSPSVSTTWLGISLAFFITLYAALGVVDFVLMRRYARPDRPGRRGAERTRAGGELLMDLQIFWFVLIGFFWAGYFVLEGFDFGVGMLLPFVPRNERRARRAVRDRSGRSGTATRSGSSSRARATFAAFPAWYATMFSGFYIALLLVLFFLIVRVVSFEWREKSESPRWRAVWTGANTLGSVGVPLIWGIAFANLLDGVPLDSSGDYAGNFWDLFSVYTVLGGVAFVRCSRSTAPAT